MRERMTHAVEKELQKILKTMLDKYEFRPSHRLNIRLEMLAALKTFELELTKAMLSDKEAVADEKERKKEIHG